MLAWGRFGMALTRSCGRLTVATVLALLLARQVATVEQRLDAWCIEAAHKAGQQRQPLAVTTGFAPVLAWIVRLWPGAQIALTLDAATLSDRFVARSIAVV